MTSPDLHSFCNNWLNAWTGNKPEHLLSFYSDDAFYLDPANTKGLKGREQLTAYFTKLLSKNPDWVWKAMEIIPTEKGFTLKWQAIIPVRTETIELTGLDIVEMQDGKISRNEVYFDRYDWLKKLMK